MMACKGISELCGKDCNLCNRLFDDCDGHPGWGDYNGEWLPAEEIADREARKDVFDWLGVDTRGMKWT